VEECGYHGAGQSVPSHICDPMAEPDPQTGAALEAAERWCVGLRLHERIAPEAYQRRMSRLARGERTPRRD
jgi:hypothetical protein